MQKKQITREIISRAQELSNFPTLPSAPPPPYGTMCEYFPAMRKVAIQSYYLHND